MKLIFDKIVIDNFLSFGHAELSFRNRGYVSVVGQNNNEQDSATSNGSGKSSIFNALSFALTGKTIQGLDKDLNNIYTNGDMSVEVDFSVDKDEYVVIRSRDSKGTPNLKVIVNGVDKSGKGVKESQDILNGYLPEITNELLGEVIIIGQGMPHKLSDNTPSGRKEILENLSHSETAFDDIKKGVDKRVAILTEQQQSLNATKIGLESELNIFKGQQEKLLREKEELDKLNVETLKADIQSKEETIKKLQIDIQVKQEKLNNDELEVQNISARIQELLESKTKELDNEQIKYEEITKPLNESIRELTSNIATKESLIKSTHCPTCGQLLPHKEDIDIEETNKSINELKKELVSHSEELGVKNGEHLSKQTAINTKTEEKKKELYSKQRTLQDEINTLKQVINNSRETQTNAQIELGKLESQLGNVESNKNTNTQSLLEINQKILDKNKDLEYNTKETEKVKNHLDMVKNKIKTQVTRAFRGVLLTPTIDYLDSKCKEYALEIFGNTNLDFKLNGSNIDISYQGKPLENLSGGEQQKVNLIIQFAIRSMMQEFTDFNTNIIVLDEILDNLDSLGCDKVLEFITKELNDIESIFIISHHADSLNICSDETIQVVKDKNGVSSIING